MSAFGHSLGVDKIGRRKAAEVGEMDDEALKDTVHIVYSDGSNVTASM